MRFFFLALLLLLLAPAVAGAQDYMQWPTLQGAGSRLPLRATFAPPGGYSSFVAPSGQSLICQRNTAAPYFDNGGLLHLASTNQARFDALGLVGESAVNGITNPQNVELWSTYNGGTGTVTVTGGAAPFIDGSNAMALVDMTAAANTANVYKFVFVANGTGPFLGSLYASPFTAGDVETVDMGCNGHGPAVTCTCTRESGGACTAAVAADGNCIGYASLTARDRFYIKATCTTATGGQVALAAHAGQYGSTVGKGYFAGGQVDQDTLPTTYSDGDRAADTNQIELDPASCNSNGCDLTATVIPEWASSARTDTRRVAFGYPDGTSGLWWDGATGSWAWTAEGTTVKVASSFAAKTQHKLEGTFARGGQVCLTVDGVTPATCSAATAINALPGTLYLLGDNGTSGLTSVGFNGYLASLTAKKQVTSQNIEFIGDSITAGYGVNPSFPTTILRAISAGYTVTNDGIFGNTTAQMLVRYQAGAAKRSQYAVVVLGGVNDCGTSNNVPAATVEANLQAIYDDVLAKGEKLVANEIMPFSGSSIYSVGAQSCIDTVNSWMNSYLSGKPGATVVHLYSTMGNSSGGNAQQLLPAYDSSDHIHPGQTGANSIASQDQTALGL